MKYFLQLIVGTYLGLAPIYWLPGISSETLGNVKIGLFILSVTLVVIVAMAGNKIRIPVGMAGPLGLALTILSTAGSLLHAETHLIFTTLKDYILVFTTLWIIYVMVQIRINIEQTMVFSALMVACACAVVVAAKYAGGPDFKGPAEYLADHLWISGFGSLRTGWSNGVALYVMPLALVFGRKNTRVNFALKFGSILAILAIVLSQYIVAGRAGLLASILIIGIALNYPGKRKFLMILAVAGSLLLLLNSNSFYEQMRIIREDTGHAEVGSFDTISAGRLEGSLIGIRKALESPIFGNGLQSVIIGHDEIHNLWIRLAAESGFPAPIVLLSIVFIIVKAAYISSRNRNDTAEGRYQYNVYLGGILAGLFISMLEPRILLGTFQISIMWWVFAGIVLHRYYAIRKIKKTRQTPTSTYPQRVNDGWLLSRAINLGLWPTANAAENPSTKDSLKYRRKMAISSLETNTNLKVTKLR